MGKIIEVLDYEALGEIIEKLRTSTIVEVNVVNQEEQHILKYNDKNVFIFECCRCGNPQYNATSGIMETINGLTSQKAKWTRKQVQNLLCFRSLRVN